MDGYSNRIIHFRNPVSRNNNDTEWNYSRTIRSFNWLRRSLTPIRCFTVVLFRTVRDHADQGLHRWGSLDNVVVYSKLQEFLNISYYIGIEIKRNETFLHCTRQQINNTMVRKFYMREAAHSATFVLIVCNDEVNFMKSVHARFAMPADFKLFSFLGIKRDSLERFKNGLIAMKG